MAGSPGQALILCGPAGAGKSTLIRRLRQEFPAFRFSVSCTTRAPRQGEVHGKDYFFIDREEFERLMGTGYFAEWAEVHGNLYGTPLAAIRELLAQGADVIFDIDVQGARQLRATLPGACFIFLLPPSRAELTKRLENRMTDSPESIARRVTNARQELLAADEFDYLVVNGDQDEAYAGLRAIYLARKQHMESGQSRELRTANSLDNAARVLETWDDQAQGAGR